jgi:hypothetical protein
MVSIGVSLVTPQLQNPATEPDRRNVISNGAASVDLSRRVVPKTGPKLNTYRAKVSILFKRLCR